MKAGDLVRVRQAHLQYWPPDWATTAKVLGVSGAGVELDSLGWVSQSIVEIIPQEDSMLPPLAMRFNEGKPELSYVLTFGEALRAMARVSTCGAAKYDRGNYLKGAPLSQSADCLLRHLLAWWEGEDTDPESGQGHLAHVVWNALRLCQESMVRPDLDDRISYNKGLRNDRTAP